MAAVIENAATQRAGVEIRLAGKRATRSFSAWYRRGGSERRILYMGRRSP
jgi:hypothetical protein